MTSSVPLALALVAFALPTAAAAQRAAQAYPEAAEVPEGTDDGAAARQVMDKFSLCIFKSRRARVMEVLSLSDGNESNRRIGRLINADCLYEGELQFDRRVFRGSLFGHAYRAKFPKVPPDFSRVPKIVYGSYGDKIYDAAMPFAECVVRENGAGAHALLFSDIASKQERAAFASLHPALSACLPQGSQVQFSRTALRGFIAESLYRLASAAQQVQAAVQ